MDTTKRALMNISGLNFLDFFERAGRWPAHVATGITVTIRKWNRRHSTRKALLDMSESELSEEDIAEFSELIRKAEEKGR